jgi:hypothetical protein
VHRDRIFALKFMTVFTVSLIRPYAQALAVSTFQLSQTFNKLKKTGGLKPTHNRNRNRNRNSFLLNNEKGPLMIYSRCGTIVTPVALMSVIHYHTVF